jgi:hypothetical protein
MNETNNKQNIEIAEIKNDLKWVKSKIACIEKKLTNDIPHKIEGVNDRLNEYKLSNSKWLTGILVSVILNLLGFIGVLISVLIK